MGWTTKTTGYFLFFLFAGFCGLAQNYPRGYFRSPLDIPLYLSGNFGELRSNHFHTGLDIKTEGREGLNVYAIADGWVSRIKISAIGYGNIVYISHPNGYTSAYAHLSDYNLRITDYAKIIQYKQKSFEIDVQVPKGDLPVTKSEVIGFSGNSGGSGGPHLHFEIRDTKTEFAINPLLFGFDVADEVHPSINAYRIYALSKTSSVNRSRSANFAAEGKNGIYEPNRHDSILVYGEIGFAIHASDMLNGSPNKCGIYSVEFFMDDTLVHSQRMEKLDFNLGRYINAHCDFLQFKRNKSNIHKCYQEPNNKLPIYPVSKNRGHVLIKDHKAHPIRFIIKDVYGNTSMISDTVYGNPNPPSLPEHYESYAVEWAWNKKYTPQTPDYAIDFPAENIYRNELIKVYDHGKKDDFYSNLLEFGDDEIAVHGNYQVKLAIKNLPDSLLRYAFLAQLNQSNHISRAAGFKKDAGFISGTAKTFGRFAISLDKNAPTIKSINFEEGKLFAANQNILFAASDYVSGIDSYKLLIDGEWALMRYDAKYHRFSYTIDPNKILPGYHRLEFSVTDGVGNRKTLESNFILR